MTSFRLIQAHALPQVPGLACNPPVANSQGKNGKRL